MKKHGDWFLPDHEQHLQAWMAHPKNREIKLNGRVGYQGRKQLAALALVNRYRAGQPMRTAVDVGAHCGLWSFNLAHYFDQVHAFEPMAAHRECFVVNTEGLRNLMLHDCALGAAPGSVRLESEKGSSGNTRIVGNGDIELRTLDSFELTDVDFIKIDCEGYELPVLQGAVATIERCKPVIVVEQKRDMAEQMGHPRLGAVDLLLERGYRVDSETSGDYFLVPG